MSDSSTILKIGGSLFDMPELADRIQKYLETETGGVVLIAGGGRFADEVRRLQLHHQFSDEAAHHLAINTMAVSARFLGELLHLPIIHRWDEIAETFAKNQIAILDVSLKVVSEGTVSPEFVLDGLQELPTSWDVTSDSIAAWIAIRAKAQRLVLGKSASLPSAPFTLQSLADHGYVDAQFPTIASHVTNIEWLNLRENSTPSPIQQC